MQEQATLTQNQKKIIDYCRSKKTTQEDLAKHVIDYNGLDNIVFLQTDYPPIELTDFQRLKQSPNYKRLPIGVQEEKEKNFLLQPFIKKYFDDKWNKELNNNVNFFWLLELKSYLSPDDDMRINKINNKIKEFYYAFIRKIDGFQVLKIDFIKLNLSFIEDYN